MFFSEEPKKRKRVDLNLKTKAELLSQLSNNEITRSQIEMLYNVSQSTISGWLKRENKIITYIDPDTENSENKRDRKTIYPKTQKLLYEWYNLAHDMFSLTHIPITETLLHQKANNLVKITHEGESVSRCFVQKFMKRKKLKSIRLCGEGSSAPISNLDYIHSVIGKYKPENVFNMDETGLYFQQLPTRCIVKRTEKSNFKGFKVAKQRISIVVSVNMNNSLQIPLLFIGKNKKPNCFKEIPKNYICQKRAWMDSNVFLYWIDFIFIPAIKDILVNTKILLVMDNCSSHPKHLDEIKYKNLNILYLPPNTTSLYQPLDQGIIQSLKTRYKTMILRECMEIIENFNTVTSLKVSNGKGGIRIGKSPTIADAIYYMTYSYYLLKTSTVINCWIHSKIITEQQQNLIDFDKKHISISNIDENKSLEYELNILVNCIKDIKIVNSNNTFITASSLYNTKSIEDLLPFLNFENNPSFQIDIIDNYYEDNPQESNISEDKDKITNQKIKRKVNEILNLSCNYNEAKRRKTAEILEVLKTELEL